jgi:predicted AlkP superfamily pyrophosphatase or phosphodiesterase
MYTGAEPSVHGIEQYEKKLITIDSLYDALARAGKKVALIAGKGWSMGTILLEREIDYYLLEIPFDEGGAARIQAKAAELIVKDEYDVIIVYNGFYDSAMHRFGPESMEALAELRSNCYAFAEISELVENLYGDHNTLVAFAADHGCHEIDGGLGSHGLDMPEDRNVVHLYKGYPKKK